MNHLVRQSSREAHSPTNSTASKHDSSFNSHESVQTTAGRIALEGYQRELAAGSNEEQVIYNPVGVGAINGFYGPIDVGQMNAKRPQSSNLLNIHDPVQVHLLVETALDDSSEYVILVQDEVDSLKRQTHRLEQQISQTRQNLAVQSKFRDAAVSMVKLYSARSSLVNGKRTRTSILAPKRSSGSFTQADQERVVSEQRCHDLALELWHLEKTLMSCQRRLLQHTAGILQMTHKGPIKVAKSNGDGGMPDSPSSMYAYNNSQPSIDATNGLDVFDERSLYRAFDQLDGFTGRPQSSRRPTSTSNNAQFNEQLNTITKTEAKLDSMNKQLREIIVRWKPDAAESMSIVSPSTKAGNRTSTTGASNRLISQLEDLDASVAAVCDHMDRVSEDNAYLVMQHHDKDAALTGSIHGMQQELHSFLPNQEYVPDPLRSTSDNHIAYLNHSTPVLVNELQRLRSLQSDLENLREEHTHVLDTVAETQHALERANSTKSKHALQTEEFEATLKNLWDTIQSNDHARDTIGDTGDNTTKAVHEPFSLQNFSSTVQTMLHNSAGLKEQKDVLTRQIQQQRELNKSDTAELTTKLASHQQALESARQEKSSLQTELQSTKDLLEQHKRDLSQRDAETTRSNDIEQELSASLQSSNAAIAALKAELQSLNDDHRVNVAETDANLVLSKQQIANLTAQLEEAQVASAIAAEKEASLKSRESEIEDMTMQIATLQTEVTIARAELDGAYGSRAQRAANVASNPAIQKEIDDLTVKNQSLLTSLTEYQDKATSAAAASSGSEERVQLLQKELTETISEFEIMTKASIEWERERDRMEAEIDRLRDERESLAAKLSDEQVRWLGMKSPMAIDSPGVEGGLRSPGFGVTSTTVMKDEFKKMMREARAEAMKALRAEQGERRKAEDELRAMKKAVLPINVNKSGE